MNKSIILCGILFAYIYGCASGEPDDKYNLVTKQDRKLLETVCTCVEPLYPLMDKMMNAKDSAEAEMYSDSLELISKKIEPCIGDLQTLEEKADRNEKFTKQFIEYIREKHPKCLPLFLGVKSKVEEIK
jgi:hypothetical protein